MRYAQTRVMRAASRRRGSCLFAVRRSVAFGLSIHPVALNRTNVSEPLWTPDEDYGTRLSPRSGGCALTLGPLHRGTYTSFQTMNNAGIR